MNCPICDDPNIPEGAESCANCGSDLRAFHDIQRVQDQRRNYKTLSLVFGVLAILLVSYVIAFRFVAPDPIQNDAGEHATMAMASDATAAPNPSEMDELKSQLIEKDAEIVTLQSEIAQLEATMQSSFDDVKDKDHTIHVVKEGETLWSISEMYHGHGFEHATIAGHNEVNNMDHIEVGDSIIIKH
ncbi:MAG: LysM domain-containing protein [Cryomorphaceae bacterium]